MGDFYSFAEVLEQKIRSEILKEASAFSAPTAPQPSNFDDSPSCLAQILGSLDKTTLSQKSKAQTYHRHRPPPRPRLPHALTDAQANALAWFIQNGSPITACFSLKELKSCFRSLALKLHPDQGGTAREFMELKNAFDLLKAVVSNY